MSVRCFVAVELPVALVVPLSDACVRIRNSDSTWQSEKWVAPENLHLTLAFIGSVADDKLPALRKALASVSQGHSGFDLAFSGVRAVPEPRRCRMVWTELLDPDGACGHLAEELTTAAVPYGAEPDKRLFIPHITLCRARRPHALVETALEAGQESMSLAPNSMSVRQVTLFTSRLTPRGPVYARVDAWHLWGE